MLLLSRSAGAVALAAFLAVGPAWAADPAPVPPRGADEIGPRVIDLGGHASPGTRVPVVDTMSRFYSHPSGGDDTVAYGYGGGLWGGDDGRGWRDHRFLTRSDLQMSRSSGGFVAFRGPREAFPGGGIASPAISNFTPQPAFRSGGFIGSGRR